MKLDELRELREAATPGPWFYREWLSRWSGKTGDPHRPPDQAELWSINSETSIVVEGWCSAGASWGGPGLGIRESDARLIALAPDLARLVCELGGALAQMTLEWDERNHVTDSTYDAADAALASLAELGER